MGKFFSLDEIALFMIIILLFDLNAFVNLSVEQIEFSKRINYIGFYIALGSIIYTSYLLHTLVEDKGDGGWIEGLVYSYVVLVLLVLLYFTDRKYMLRGPIYLVIFGYLAVMYMGGRRGEMGWMKKN